MFISNVVNNHRGRLVAMAVVVALVALLLQVVGFGSPAQAAAVTTTCTIPLNGGGHSSQSVVVDNTTGIAYASDGADGEVQAFNAATRTATLIHFPLFVDARSMAINQTTGVVYVTNNQTDAAVYAIDTRHGNTVTEIDPPTPAPGTWVAPEAVAVDQVTGMVYVTSEIQSNGGNTDWGVVSEIDPATNAYNSTVIQVGSFVQAIAIDSTTGTAFVNNENNNTITSIDLTTNAVTTIPVPGAVGGLIAVDEGTSTAYVSSFLDGGPSFWAIKEATDVATAIALPSSVGLPSGVAVDEAAGIVYLADFSSGTVYSLDPTTNTFTGAPGAVGPQPIGIAVDPTTGEVFVALDGSVNGVTVLSCPVQVAPTITSSAPTNGTANSPYSFTVTATGVPAPTFSVTSGSLPDGLSLDAITGVISGTPTSGGQSTFTIEATNVVDPPSTATYTLSIAAAPLITSGAPPDASTSVAYSFDVTATGDPTPTFSVTSGSLPAGLMLDGTSGEITGTATTDGSSTFEITASNGVDPDASATYTVNVTTPVPPLQPSTVTCSVSATVPLGSGAAPWAVAVDDATSVAYVANRGSGTVSAIDEETGTTTAINFPAHIDAIAIAVDSATGTAFVVDDNSRNVYAIDTATNAVSLIAPPTSASGTTLIPEAIAVDPATGIAYVANRDEGGPISGMVTEIDTTTNTFTSTQIPVGAFPGDIAIDATAGTAYADNEDNTISAVNLTTDAVTSIPIPSGTGPLSRLAVDEATGTVYVTDYGAGAVSAINTTTDAVVSVAVPAGVAPFGITVDQAAGIVYLGSISTNSVLTLDPAADAFTSASTSVGRTPVGLAVDQATGAVFTTNLTDSTASVLSCRTAPTITSGSPPDGTVGTGYSFALTGTGDPAPTFTVSNATLSTGVTSDAIAAVIGGTSIHAVSSGALPSGLSLNASTGLVSGTPTTAGAFTFTLTARNGTHPDATATYTVTITAATTPDPGVTPPIHLPIVSG